MTDPDLSQPISQLVTLASNVGLTRDQLEEIIREVDKLADAENRKVSIAERLIAVRARVMTAALR